MREFPPRPAGVYARSKVSHHHIPVGVECLDDLVWRRCHSDFRQKNGGASVEDWWRVPNRLLAVSFSDTDRITMDLVAVDSLGVQHFTGEPNHDRWSGQVDVGIERFVKVFV